MRDISADKQAREELREREEEYRAIFESAMDAFLIFDTSGFIKEANSAACKLYGYTKKEMLRLSGRSIVSPDQYYKFEKFLKKTSGKEIFQEESIDVRKDGSCVNVEVRGSFFIYRAKPHCLAVIRDVTEKKKIEKAQNLANLGELVENIGHEMNNPLQVMLGRTELLLMNKPTQEELRASLGIIRDQCECARNIVKQMRVISTAGLEHFSIIDLNESLETVIGLMEHQFSLHDIDVRRKYYKGSLLMEVDEKKMRQVFFNLLKNAVDAIGNRGVITVTTRLKDNKFIIKIIDSGPGIREEHIKKVLEPFFTTKYDRTGLGLSICSSIIKAHNGQLEILNNRLGAGTVATIVLPTVGNKL
jgi:PAS domain S-box-containing protein